MAKKWNFRCRKEDFAVAMNGTLFFQNDDGVYTPVGYINEENGRCIHAQKEKSDD